MDYSEFSPEFKDSVLKKLCENIDPYSLVGIKASELCGDFTLLKTCLIQFQELGLIRDLNLRRNSDDAFFMITADAIDLLNRGGFTLMENTLLNNLEQAQLQLEKLKAETGSEKHIEMIAHITGIITNLITTFSTLRG